VHNTFLAARPGVRSHRVHVLVVATLGRVTRARGQGRPASRRDAAAALLVTAHMVLPRCRCRRLAIYGTAAAPAVPGRGHARVLSVASARVSPQSSQPRPAKMRSNRAPTYPVSPSLSATMAIWAASSIQHGFVTIARFVVSLAPPLTYLAT
jgi:hypothetical protein